MSRLSYRKPIDNHFSYTPRRTLFENKLIVYSLVGISLGIGFIILSSLVDPLKAIIIFLGFIIGILILFRSNIGFILMLASIPLDRIGKFTEAQAIIPLSASKILGIITLLSWLIHTLHKKEKIHFPRDLLPMILFIIWGCVTLLYTTTRFDTEQMILRYVTTLFFIFLVVNIINSEKILKLSISSLLAMTLLVSIFNILLFYLFPIYTFEGEDTLGIRVDVSELERVGIVKALHGMSVEPAIYQQSLLISMPLYLHMFQNASSFAMKVIWGIGGILATFNFFLTQRRAGIVALIFILIYIFAKKLIKMTPKIVIICMIVFFIAVIFMPGTFWERIFSISAYDIEQSNNIHARVELFKAGVKVIKEHWLLGVGFGNHTEVTNYVDLKDIAGESGTFNGYLQLWLESGIIGFLLFLFILYLFWHNFSHAEKCFLGRNTYLYRLSGFLKCSFLVVPILALLSMEFGLPMRDWWFICGLSFIMKTYSQNSLKNTT